MAFLDEVAEQGKVLHDLIHFYRGEGDDLLCQAAHFASHAARSIIFIGMGTSEFVPVVIRDYLGAKSHAPVVLWEAGELLNYGMESIRDDDVIVAISQSGESVETRKIVENLRDHRRLISMTNDPESTIARLSRLNLPILAGKEVSISNKTYTNSIAASMLLSRALAGVDHTPVFADLELAADQMEEFLASRRCEIEPAAELLHDAHTVYLVSRGPAFAAARQAALTFQEGSHVFTCALQGGSMRHGPFEIVGQGHCAVIFASEGHGGDLLRKMALEMAELGSKVVLFTSQGVSGRGNFVGIVLELGDPELFSLACAVPQELLIERMAAHRGWTAGVFARGGKITSRE